MVKWAVYVFLLTLAHFSKADDLSQFLDAAAFGDEETLSALLEKGSVTVNQRNAFGESALHLASIKPKLEIVQFLLKAGADPSAFTEGSYQGSAGSFQTALRRSTSRARAPAARAGHAAVVRRSVLMWFIGHRCHEECIGALLAAGADVSFVNEEGQTALDLAQSPQCSDRVPPPPRRLGCACAGARRPFMLAGEAGSDGLPRVAPSSNRTPCTRAA